MKDAPLWSPRRLWLAFVRWGWWGGDQGLWFPFGYFIRFEGRPAACDRWLKAHPKPLVIYTDTPWYTKKEMWG